MEDKELKIIHESMGRISFWELETERSLDDFIELVKREAEVWKDGIYIEDSIRIKMNKDYGYYDEVDVYLEILVDRYETDREYQARMKKNEAARKAAEKRKAAEAIKKKKDEEKAVKDALKLLKKKGFEVGEKKLAKSKKSA